MQPQGGYGARGKRMREACRHAVHLLLFGDDIVLVGDAVLRRALSRQDDALADGRKPGYAVDPQRSQERVV